ncbi:mitochondrial 18 KDa protein-domain-containing protein [Leptodontidium sp. MPI-SDFR-AT-0119]|nr:mitochondrial 18 KDa protein-domain-containing protein [Leptodontidium sp. MPI-SDFR-AT-0119]
MSSKDSDKSEPRGPPPTGLPPREKLPPSFQKIIDKSDNDDNFYDELYDGTAPQSTESNIRYAAYVTRIRTALLSAQRYVAYTSDIGESFRPVAHPNLVRTAYGISWAYILGDVAHEGYKAYCSNQRILHPDLPREASTERYNNAQTDLKTVAADAGVTLMPGRITALEDYRTVMAQRAIFQSIASMGLPAFTIHSIVRYSGRALKNSKNVRIRTYGPIGLGLAAVPALPYLFDKPVEEAVEWVFHKGFQMVGGKEAVGNAPSTGREQILELRTENAASRAANKENARKKEKEL